MKDDLRFACLKLAVENYEADLDQVFDIANRFVEFVSDAAPRLHSVRWIGDKTELFP